MSTANDIRDYFSTALTALNLSNLSIEGDRFEPKANLTYTRFKLFTNEAVNSSIGVNGRVTVAGLASIEVIVPRASGISAADAIADTIMAAFPRGTTSEPGLIIFSTWVEAAREEPPHLRLPIFVRWQCIK